MYFWWSDRLFTEHGRILIERLNSTGRCCLYGVFLLVPAADQLSAVGGYLVPLPRRPLPSLSSKVASVPVIYSNVMVVPRCG